MLIFGSIGLFVRAIPLSSSEIVAARTILGSLFLCVILLCRKQQLDWSRLKQNLLLLIVTGVVMGLNWMFLFMAYQYTSVSVATLIYYIAPVLVLILSPILLQERLTWPKLVGILAAFIGMVLVNGVQSGGADPQKGLLFGLLAAIFYASLIILNKRIVGVPATEKTFVQLLSAAAVMGIYAAITHSGGWQLPQGTALFALFIIGFVHTGVAYLLYISSMQELPGQTVALCSYVDPASALLFSAIFLEEKLMFVQLLGALFILGGSAFGELYRYKRELI